MRLRLVLPVTVTLLIAGCAGSGRWDYTALKDIRGEPGVLKASDCAGCHEREYQTWARSRHSKESVMQAVPSEELHQCGACHSNLPSHPPDPENNHPVKIATLSKTEQNAVCGKCHHNKELLGTGAINPQGKHGLITNVGFSQSKHQLSCLDCHSGHTHHSGMLKSIRAHTCFKCHKEAIITMGVFQPLNYLGAGRVCFACHPPHGASKPILAARLAVGMAGTCVICHLPGVQSEE